jgi:hypothetical protein
VSQHGLLVDGQRQRAGWDSLYRSDNVRARGAVPAITDGMSGFLRLFLLPTLFLVASIYVLRLATARGSFIMYFVAAVLLGMGIAAYLRAWKRPPKE